MLAGHRTCAGIRPSRQDLITSPSLIMFLDEGRRCGFCGIRSAQRKNAMAGRDQSASRRPPGREPAGTLARVSSEQDHRRSSVAPSIDELCINTIRTLSMDAVQQANSGHPGTPMALAPVAYTVWQKFLRFDPEHPI